MKILQRYDYATTTHNGFWKESTVALVYITEWRFFGLLLHYRWHHGYGRSRKVRLYRGHGLPAFLRPQWQKDRL